MRTKEAFWGHTRSAMQQQQQYACSHAAGYQRRRASQLKSSGVRTSRDCSRSADGRDGTTAMKVTLTTKMQVEWAWWAPSSIEKVFSTMGEMGHNVRQAAAAFIWLSLNGFTWLKTTDLPVALSPNLQLYQREISVLTAGLIFQAVSPLLLNAFVLLQQGGQTGMESWWWKIGFTPQLFRHASRSLLLPDPSATLREPKLEKIASCPTHTKSMQQTGNFRPQINPSNFLL
eukprot:1161225-Pelagomonas_calceolata.AAC.1